MRALLAELPAIQAEESLQAVERQQVGSGRLKRGQAESVIRGWQRLLPGWKGAQPQLPSTLGGLRALFAGSSVRVEGKKGR